jgi:hypothetical protein
LDVLTDRRTDRKPTTNVRTDPTIEAIAAIDPTPTTSLMRPSIAGLRER